MKPSDKEVCVSLKFLSIKELNEPKKKMKIIKAVRRNFFVKFKEDQAS
jgi:hypothetical protein